MDFTQSTMLPYIMELVSREDNVCTTVEELTESVKDVMLEKQIHPFGSLEMAVKFALEVGTNMGILSMEDHVLPAPFNYISKKPALKNLYTTALGRQAVQRMLAKCRAKAKACARKRPGKKAVSDKQAARTKTKTNHKGAKQNLKAKSKKRCS